MKLSIIIPVFNEENTVVKVIEAVEKIHIPFVVKEIIVVDDASTDATIQQLKKLMKKNKNIKILFHKTNQGKAGAISTGLHHARGDYIIIQDADLEYNPKDIEKLVAIRQEKNVDVVFGTRLRRFPHITKEEKRMRFLLHFFGNRFLSLITSILYGQWVTDMETGYKLFPKDALSKITLQEKGFAFEPEITAKFMKNGYKILEIPIVTNPRGPEAGKKLRAHYDGPRALWTLIKYRFQN